MAAGGPTVRIASLLLLLACKESWADLDDGIKAYKRGDFATAFAEFSVAARQDYPVAQNTLGTMYAQGQGTERNYKLALDWFFKAQALGSTEAMANLAKMYAAGLGVPKDDAMALKYYHEAAIDGFRPAMRRLAEIYEKGELGEAPDAKLALKWRTRLGMVPDSVDDRPANPVAEASASVRSSTKAAALLLPKSPVQTKVVPVPVPVRLNQGDPFEKQVLRRLENYQQRERKMFVGSSDSTPSIAPYLKQLRAQLAILSSAFSASKHGERIIVTMSILRDGTLREVELNQGSGNATTDKRVLSSLKKHLHLQPLPAETAGIADVLVATVRLPIE